MYIKVKVFPKSKKEELKEISDPKLPVGQGNRFEIKIKEKAERNLANNKVLKLLAEYFNIKENKIKIINGHHHPVKLLKVINED